METKFTQFLRTGGSGEFFLRRKADAWVGGQIAFSIKSEFPNYAALRDSFAAKLDAVIQANTTMLLQAVGGLYNPPLTAAELPGVTAARAETLTLWEDRIEVIWSEWHSHLQRLRPIREAMEQHLLRGFAGLINELRQRALGIRQYVWRSRDDGKVRSAHAHYDDQIFSWDDPPEGGHPGQAFNCRCHAEPYVQDQAATAPKNWDGFAFRYGDADRDQMRRNAEAEMRALRPAIEALAALLNKTADQEAQQRALAEAFRATAYRYELASREPGALARSGLLFGPDADRARLIAEAEAYRKGADDMAQGMSTSPFFDGIHPSAVLGELRQDAPQSADKFLNSLILMAGVQYLPQGLVGEENRLSALRDIGRGSSRPLRSLCRTGCGSRPDGASCPRPSVWLLAGCSASWEPRLDPRCASPRIFWTMAEGFWGKGVPGSALRFSPAGLPDPATSSKSCRVARYAIRPLSAILPHRSPGKRSQYPMSMGFLTFRPSLPTQAA